MDDLTIFVNTHSRVADLWPMFFGCLQRHWPWHPRVIVASNRKSPYGLGWSPLPPVKPCRCGHDTCDHARDDEPCWGGLWVCGEDENSDYEWVHVCVGHQESDEYGGHEYRQPNLEDFCDKLIDYSPAKKFSNQYLMGLCAVETPYVLTMQEDFLLYADVDEAAIESSKPRYNDCNRLIDSGRTTIYSMQASIWKTGSLRQVYSHLDAPTPWDAEISGGQAMVKAFASVGIRRDDDLPMRGRDHRDSPVFPYIATALVKGKWNHEYRAELEPLHKKYGIDAALRGWTA